MLDKWQGPFEVVRRQGPVNYVVRLPSGLLKSFHINLLKVWLENDEVRASYGEEWNWPSRCEDQGVEEPRKDEDNLLSPVQQRNVYLVIMAFPDVFVDRLGTAKGWEHKMITTPDVVVRTPLCPITLASRQVLQHEVNKMLQLGMIEESHSLWRSPP